MKLFLDTAKISEIKEISATGLLDGVTTNPTLIHKAGIVDFEAHIREICAAVQGPVSVEVAAIDAENMVKEGKNYFSWAKNVVVKVPCTWQGLEAVQILKKEGIPTNVTLCFSVNQALLAAKAGASYISPFVGRLDDISEPGMQLVEDILTIYEIHGLETEVLVASVRHPRHIAEAALLGADCCTLPYDIFKKLLQHPLTDRGLEQFLADFQASFPSPKS